MYQSHTLWKKNSFWWLILHNPQWLRVSTFFLPKSSPAATLILWFIFQVTGQHSRLLAELYLEPHCLNSLSKNLSFLSSCPSRSPSFKSRHHPGFFLRTSDWLVPGEEPAEQASSYPSENVEWGALLLDTTQAGCLAFMSSEYLWRTRLVWYFKWTEHPAIYSLLHSRAGGSILAPIEQMGLKERCGRSHPTRQSSQGTAVSPPLLLTSVRPWTPWPFPSP